MKNRACEKTLAIFVSLEEIAEVQRILDPFQVWCTSLPFTPRIVAIHPGKVHALHSRCVPSSPRSSPLTRQLLHFQWPVNGTCHDFSCEDATDSWFLSLYKERISFSFSHISSLLFIFLATVTVHSSLSLSSFIINIFLDILGSNSFKSNLLVLILGNFQEVLVVSWGTFAIHLE